MRRSLIINLIIGTVFLYVLSFLFDGIVIDGIVSAVVAAVLLALVNATLKPLLVIISLPITILTLGIFYLILNALMLMLVSAFVPGFTVVGFGTAFFAAIVLSLLNAFLGDN